MSKQYYIYLKNAKFALVTNFKIQKLELAYCFNTKQSCINDNKFNINNTRNTSNKNIDTDMDINKKKT